MTDGSRDEPQDAAARLWRQGSYRRISALLTDLGRAIVEAGDIREGTTVLDVAAGDGNVSLAAARAGGRVVATDVTVELLRQGEEAASRQGLAIDWQYADAQDLPFETARFDRVVSAIGAMFAPDQRRTAAELARVCRPGGRIVMANWTPGGSAKEFLDVVSRYVDASPPPGDAPTAWGSPDHVEALLGPYVDHVDTTDRGLILAFDGSADELAEQYVTFFPPVVAIAAGLDSSGREQLTDDLSALFRRIDRGPDGGPPRYTLDYLLVVATRAG